MITVKFWVYIRNSGDGSNSLIYFDSEEQAELFANSDSDERYCEDIQKVTLSFNQDGTLFKDNTLSSYMTWKINPVPEKD